jgi:hypothetical protein
MTAWTARHLFHPSMQPAVSVMTVEWQTTTLPGTTGDCPQRCGLLMAHFHFGGNNASGRRCQGELAVSVRPSKFVCLSAGDDRRALTLLEELSDSDMLLQPGVVATRIDLHRRLGDEAGAEALLQVCVGPFAPKTSGGLACRPVRLSGTQTFSLPHGHHTYA